MNYKYIASKVKSVYEETVSKIKSTYDKIKSSIVIVPEGEEDTYVFEVRKSEVLMLVETLKEKFGGELPEVDDEEKAFSVFHMLRAAEKNIRENEIAA